ncbi:MAG: L-threonylcarbamoyladenylate synthase, partial [Blastocatellia bacterium]
MVKTLVLEVGPNAPDTLAIERAASIIKSGGLVAFPTETVYGLGADACSEAAVRRIFEAKGRPVDNPLIVHICDVAMLSDVALDAGTVALDLAAKFWPGPLTLVLKRAAQLAPSVSAGLATVAVRMPDNTVALDLIRAAGTPIAAPSANASGRPSPTSAVHVLEDLDGKIDMVLNGGRTQIGIESTVLDLTAHPAVVLRPGWITQESIADVIGEVRFAHSEDQLKRSPGTRHRHYTPRAEVVLVEKSNSAELTRVLNECLRTGAVAYIGHSRVDLDHPNLTKIALSEEPGDYASSIYSTMRELDSRGVQVIVIEGIEGGGEALAVMDRL